MEKDIRKEKILNQIGGGLRNGGRIISQRWENKIREEIREWKKEHTEVYNKLKLKYNTVNNPLRPGNSVNGQDRDTIGFSNDSLVAKTDVHSEEALVIGNLFGDYLGLFYNQQLDSCIRDHVNHDAQLHEHYHKTYAAWVDSENTKNAMLGKKAKKLDADSTTAMFEFQSFA